MELSNIVRIIKFLKKGKLYVILLGFIDFVALTLSFQIAYTISTGIRNINFFAENDTFKKSFIIIMPLWYLLLLVTGTAQIPRTRKYSRIFFEFAQFSLFYFVTLLLITLLFGGITKFGGIIFIFSNVIASYFFLVTFRLVEYKVSKLYRSKGNNRVNVVLIADGLSELFVADILDKKEWGYRVLLMVSSSKLLKAKFGDRVKIISDKGFYSLKTYLEVDIVDEVIYCKNKHDHEKINNLIHWCEELGIIFKFPANLSRMLLTNGFITYLGSKRFITFANIPMNSLGITWKNGIDFFFSLIAIICLLPVFIMLALIIKLDSKGPIFFKQARVGLRGRQFYLYKFRTMVVNAEEIRKKLEEQNEMDGPVFKIKNDPRITKIGGILRKTGLDELPQLLNVIRGEMSIIGPRPPLMSEVAQYKRWQLRRLSVRPGITGLWQVQPNRNAIKFEKWMEMDLEYIDEWSPSLDTKLMFKTVKTVFFRSGS
jgi:exopolysaccharide biosynthesis polyprenyl glycosylphosphotransferase